MGNTKTDWKTTAHIRPGSDRAALWQAVFGGLEVPVVSFLPQSVTLPGYDEPQPVYMLDLKALSDEQRFRLIQALADKFCVLEGEVESSLDEHGVPILVTDVSVSSTDRALVMGAIL